MRLRNKINFFSLQLKVWIQVAWQLIVIAIKSLEKFGNNFIKITVIYYFRTKVQPLVVISIIFALCSCILILQIGLWVWTPICSRIIYLICFDIAFAQDKVTSHTFNHLSKFLVNINQFAIDIWKFRVWYPAIYSRISGNLEPDIRYFGNWVSGRISNIWKWPDIRPCLVLPDIRYSAIRPNHYPVHP